MLHRHGGGSDCVRGGEISEMENEHDTLKIVLRDHFNQRKVVFKTSLAGEHIDHYYEVFEAFLLSVGFSRETIDRRYEQ